MECNIDKDVEYLIIGAGLSGSVIARKLADKGHKVEIWDRRNHIGGNMYDYIDEHGILVQKYGPHTFHTKNKELFDFMNKYADWEPFELTCMAEIDGKMTPSPFNFQTIDDFYSVNEGKELKKRLLKEFPNKKSITVVEALDAKDAKIREYANFLFEKDYSLYTAKQWGISASEIDPNVLKRVPLLLSYERSYLGDPIEVMPKDSFTNFFENLLDNPNIKIKLGLDALNYMSIDMINHNVLINGEKTLIKIVYTGALDELFSASNGYLPYRSLRFDFIYEEKIKSKQDAPVVAYPQVRDFTRITEFKKIPKQDVIGTSYAIEYPIQYEVNKNEPYYPILTELSKKQYNQYKKLADEINNFYYCGRLADFKYYNMDMALLRALLLLTKIE